MCYTRLAENTCSGRKESPSAHHRTTLPAISSQLRHVSIIRKKLVKQQYVLHMSSQYGELRPTNGWDRLAGLDNLFFIANFSWTQNLASVFYYQKVYPYNQRSPIPNHHNPPTIKLLASSLGCPSCRPTNWSKIKTSLARVNTEQTSSEITTPCRQECYFFQSKVRRVDLYKQT